MTTRSTQIFSITILCFLTMLCACGKVTQEVNSKDKPKAKAFSMTFQTPLYTPDRLAASIAKEPKFPSANYLDTQSTIVYVAINGIHKTSGPKQLSWGQAFLSKKELTTKNKDRWSAKAKNIHNVSISGANLGETVISLKTPTTNAETLHIRSAKLRYGYPLYLASIYTGPNNYQLFIVDEKTASDNPIVSKGTISHYDTFISVLFLMSLEKYEKKLDKAPSLKTLKTLFDPSFFDLLAYKNPMNKTKSFKPKKPLFRFNRSLENNLIEVLDMLYHTDKTETTKHINSIKQDILSKKAKAHLISTLKDFTVEAPTSPNITISESTANVTPSY
ncbi:hypothetical protein DID77_00825 [Candidatus Marinamargulisbacteria bacterium SCGC AG-439-L15]|nr:hypothetical protein DID77_00825 [Candidatus Marinamargulisbacteria bacterium SCGC AG-439-L15]